MRSIIGDAERAVAVYLAWVLVGAAVGALVGQLVLGQWFLGALAGCLLAWFALPTAHVPVVEPTWTIGVIRYWSPLPFDVILIRRP